MPPDRSATAQTKACLIRLASIASSGGGPDTRNSYTPAWASNLTRASGLARIAAVQQAQAAGAAASREPELVVVSILKRAIATATSRHLIAACMLEAKAVFERQGFALDDKLLGPLKLLSLPDWIFDCAFAFMQGLLPADEFESSMNQDLAAADGRATEVAYLNGVVVDAGKAAGVPTPMTEKVLAIVRDMEQGRRPRRLLTVDEAEALFFS